MAIAGDSPYCEKFIHLGSYVPLKYPQTQSSLCEGKWNKA